MEKMEQTEKRQQMEKTVNIEKKSKFDPVRFLENTMRLFPDKTNLTWMLIQLFYKMNPEKLRVIGTPHTDGEGSEPYVSVRLYNNDIEYNTIHFYGTVRGECMFVHRASMKAYKEVHNFVDFRRGF